MTYEKISQEITKKFNEHPEIKKMLANIVPQSASYRYYTKQGSKDRYFYTTKKIDHKGQPRYVAGIYRYLKSQKILKLVRRVGFAKKKLAIQRANKWSKL